MKDSNTMAKSAIYGAFINVILNIILIYIFDIQGATVATLIASFIIYFIRQKVVKNYIHRNYYIRFCIIWILLIIQCVLEIYTNFWWCEILILMIIIFLHKDIIIKIFYKKKG